MVDNGAGDDVEPKPTKKEASGDASGDVKPTVNVKPFRVKIPFQARIGKIEEPKPVPIGVVCEGRDTASYFTTYARWKERQELLDWVRRQGARAGFGVCIDKCVIKRPYLTMQCERSGIYKPPKTTKKPNLEGIGSRKCNCQFRLKSFFDKDTNDWWLTMLCGMHNHDLDENLSGHLIAGRLSAEEKKKVIDMTKSLTVPRNILTNLKQSNKESVTTIKQVYNVRTRRSKGERGNMTELQYLRAWTNKVMHLGYRTTNIVESAHGVLKKYLRSSVDDLASCWDKIHKMLVMQFGEIQGSFGRNKTVLEHKYKSIKMMRELKGYVSRRALKFIYDELKRSKTFAFDKEDCGCVQKTSYRLPCACIIDMKSKQKLPLVLDDIYPHWKRLCVQREEIDDDFSVMEEWNDIQERLKTSPYNMKLYIKEMMCQIAFPETTNLCPPSKKAVTKGAPKRKRTTLKVSSTGWNPL